MQYHPGRRHLGRGRQPRHKIGPHSREGLTAETSPRHERVEGLRRSEGVTLRHDTHRRRRVKKRHTQKLGDPRAVDVHGVLPEGRGLTKKLVQPVDGGALVVQLREQLQEGRVVQVSQTLADG